MTATLTAMGVASWVDEGETSLRSMLRKFVMIARYLCVIARSGSGAAPKGGSGQGRVVALTGCKRIAWGKE